MELSVAQLSLSSGFCLCPVLVNTASAAALRESFCLTNETPKRDTEPRMASTAVLCTNLLGASRTPQNGDTAVIVKVHHLPNSVARVLHSSNDNDQVHVNNHGGVCPMNDKIYLVPCKKACVSHASQSVLVRDVVLYSCSTVAPFIPPDASVVSHPHACPCPSRSRSPISTREKNNPSGVASRVLHFVAVSVRCPVVDKEVARLHLSPRNPAASLLFCFLHTCS